MMSEPQTLYLADQVWRASASLKLDDDLPSGGSAPRYVVQGLVNDLANPKTIALFPQVIQPEQGSMAVQSFILGMMLAMMAVAWIGSVVVPAGPFASAVATNRTFPRMASGLVAMTFVGLAVRLAVQHNH